MIMEQKDRTEDVVFKRSNERQLKGAHMFKGTCQLGKKARLPLVYFFLLSSLSIGGQSHNSFEMRILTPRHHYADVFKI